MHIKMRESAFNLVNIQAEGAEDKVNARSNVASAYIAEVVFIILYWVGRMDLWYGPWTSATLLENTWYDTISLSRSFLQGGSHCLQFVTSIHNEE
jgi:hypothetical protein